MSYPGHPLRESYPSAVMYSAAPANWAKGILNFIQHCQFISRKKYYYYNKYNESISNIKLKKEKKKKLLNLISPYWVLYQRVSRFNSVESLLLRDQNGIFVFIFYTSSLKRGGGKMELRDFLNQSRKSHIFFKDKHLYMFELFKKKKVDFQTT